MRRRNAAISTLILLVAAITGPLALLAIGASTTITGFVVGFLMAVVPAPFYIAFATWVDRFEPEPPWLLGLGFLWGATIAVVFAMIFNSVAAELFGEEYLATLVGPFIEEVAKGAALVLLFLWRRDEFDNVTDGILYAAMVGLGFAMTENILYYSRAVAMDGGPGAVTIFFMRGILSPFSHPLYTSMTGIGLGLARESDRPPVKVLAPLIGLIGATLLHSLWNLSATAGVIFFAAYIFIMAPALIGVVVVAMFSLRREARIIRDHLADVVATGVLTDEDVMVVTSVERRIAASARALTQHGIAKWRARRRFHALTTELAFHAWRARRFPEEHSEVLRDELVAAVRDVRMRL